MQKFFASMLITTMLQMSVQTSRPSTGTEITTMFSMIFCHCRIFEYVVADQIAPLKMTDKITGNLAAHWVLSSVSTRSFSPKKKKKKKKTSHAFRCKMVLQNNSKICWRIRRCQIFLMHWSGSFRCRQIVPEQPIILDLQVRKIWRSAYRDQLKLILTCLLTIKMLYCNTIIQCSISQDSHRLRVIFDTDSLL